MRNKRELNARLKGVTLGDADGAVDDTRKWIKRSKAAEKELARKRQQELESRDKMFQEEYTESTCGSVHCAGMFANCALQRISRV